DDALEESHRAAAEGARRALTCLKAATAPRTPARSHVPGPGRWAPEACSSSPPESVPPAAITKSETASSHMTVRGSMVSLPPRVRHRPGGTTNLLWSRKRLDRGPAGL